MSFNKFPERTKSAIGFYASRPLQTTPVVEPVACVRCHRQIDMRASRLGDHGFRQCADVAVCTALGVKRVSAAEGGWL